MSKLYNQLGITIETHTTMNDFQMPSVELHQGGRYKPYNTQNPFQHSAGEISLL